MGLIYGVFMMGGKIRCEDVVWIELAQDRVKWALFMENL
jgi:predicted RNA-binding protein